MVAEEMARDVFANFACCDDKICKEEWVAGGFISFLSVVNIFMWLCKKMYYCGCCIWDNGQSWAEEEVRDASCEVEILQGMGGRGLHFFFVGCEGLKLCVRVRLMGAIMWRLRMSGRCTEHKVESKILQIMRGGQRDWSTIMWRCRMI